MVSKRRYEKRILGIFGGSGSENNGEGPVVDVDDPDSLNSDQGGRSSFERDLDRIKYTKEFRRLKDVTQVARAGESYLYHDRLSHSLKVAQVGRRFAEFIINEEGKNPTLSREIDPAMVEAACLAHDLGHPPFGHLAESTLDELLQEKTNPYREENDLEPVHEDLPENLDARDADNVDAYLLEEYGELAGIRFEGNAQSFRILCRLANHRNANTGLGLTVGVFLGVGKYPYGRGEWFDKESHERIDPWPDDPISKTGRSDDKFGFYCDDENFNKAVRYSAAEGDEYFSDRSAAAGIMDYADDLTYAIHDLTDFYVDGRLPLDRLLREAIGEIDEEDQEGLEEADYEDAPRRELEKLDRDLDYDADIATPTEVLISLVSTAILTGENASLLEPFGEDSEQRNELEGFTSFLIGYYLNRVYSRSPEDEGLDGKDDAFVTLDHDDHQCALRISERLDEQLSILQQITKYYVIRQPSLMAQQRGQRQIIRETFQALYEESGKQDLSWSAIPTPFSDWLNLENELMAGLHEEKDKRARVIADFIASMTEPQLVAIHKRLTGDAPGSLQDEIIR